MTLIKFPYPNLFGLDDISNATVQDKSVTHSHSGIVSLFTRINYTFDERYLLTATVRGDGSSKFAKGHKWGVFPSLSGAWTPETPYLYLLTVSLVDANGKVIHTTSTRIGFRTIDFRPHELWKGVRFDFASSMQMTKVEGGGSLGGKLKQTILQPITGGARWTNDQMVSSDIGKQIGDLMNDANYDSQNPILDNAAITNEKYTRMATVNAGFEFDLMKNLTFRTAGSYMWQQVREDYWDDGSTKQAIANDSPYGYGSRNNDEYFSWQITNTLNYAFKLAEKHRFNVLLGQETSYSQSMNLDNEYRKFSDGNFGLNDVSMRKNFFIAGLVILLSSGLQAQQLAFPGAEGYGKYTSGGRGGVVFTVRNLNDSGAGSLREAVEAQGARTIVFAVDGTIELKSPLRINNDSITIAGQSAPGEGICLKDYPMVVNANNVIVRYIRVRVGDHHHIDSDGIGGGRYGQKNVILDHLTSSWSIDECLSIYKTENLTVQWCLVTHSLNNSVHTKGKHDRARTHFDAYAASQVTNVPNTIPHPAQDSALAMARSEKKWGTPMRFLENGT